jgi:hypothetical protein
VPAYIRHRWRPGTVSCHLLGNGRASFMMRQDLAAVRAARPQLRLIMSQSFLLVRVSKCGRPRA